jgi:hypothetical protein
MSNGLKSAWFAAAILAVTSPAARASSPASASRPAGAVERAMKYAPEGSAAIVHVEVKALVKSVLDGVAKGLEPNALPADKVQAAAKFAEKVEAVDIFVTPGGLGMPMPLVVIHGTLTADDFNEMLKAVPNAPPGMSLKKGENGRYTFENKDLPALVVFGGEAPELPAGVVVGGLAPMLTKST